MASHKNNQGGGGWLGIFIVIAIVLFVVAWTLSAVGHVLGLTPTYDEAFNSSDGWVSEHYRGVVVGYLLTVAFLGTVGYLAILALRAISDDAGIAHHARHALKRASYGAAVLLLLIVTLPIGARGVPGPQQAAVSSTTSPASDSVLIENDADELARERAARKAERARARRKAERQARARRARAARRQRERERLAALAAIETPEPEPALAEASSSGGDCDPNYEGACLDPSSSDYDCEGGSGDGPDYTGPVTVVGDDPYDLNRDDDPYACEVS
jgi:hypothetical protein